MSIIIPNTPRILYDNLFYRATALGRTIICNRSTASGYPTSNLEDWHSNRRMRLLTTYVSFTLGIACGTNVPFNCCAIFGHNLGSCAMSGVGSVSIIGGSPFDFVSIPAGNDEPIVFFFNQLSLNTPGINVQGLDGIKIPEVGIVFLGLCLELPEIEAPWNPDNCEIMTIGNNEFKGQILDIQKNYIERRYACSIPWISKAWVEVYLKPFFLNHVPNPFIFVWHQTLQHSNAALVCMDPAELNLSNNQMYRDWNFNFIGTDGMGAI